MKKITVLSIFVIALLALSACLPANNNTVPVTGAEVEAEPVVEPMEKESPEEAEAMEKTESDEMMEKEMPKDIVDTAAADGRFTTLLAAADAAGLVDTLKSEGPFTVFAPTDDAFAKLPAGTIEALLADTESLSNILLYHVAEGFVPAADVISMDKVATVQGKSVKVMQDMGKVMLDNAEVLITDIYTSNGVIHVIDTVLIPQNDIVETAVADGRFTTLVAAVEAANLVDTLKSEGPFTVFAPTDDAFAKLPAGTVETLLQPENIEQLSNILLYHVVAGEVLANDVVNLSEAETALGENITIRVENGSVYINDAMVIITDILTSNGVIHVIDSVILPPQ